MPKTKKYYIVDDDVDDQQYLIEALTENDCSAQCYTANNGQEAMNYLASTPSSFPDVIFLDLNMPRMGGKQCLTELKLLPLLRDIPLSCIPRLLIKKKWQRPFKWAPHTF